MNDTISTQPAGTQILSLRERKKRLVQSTIEETALRLFQQQGYEHTSIQDIAEAVLMSTRTFFRYFASKEEVLFGPMHTALNESIRSIEHVDPAESPQKALRETFVHLARLYQAQRESFLVRYRVAVQTPSIASVYIFALLEREPAIGEALCTRLEAATKREELRALVAFYMTAFRLALEVWLEHEALEDLVSLLHENLDYFSSLPNPTWKQ